MADSGVPDPNTSDENLKPLAEGKGFCFSTRYIAEEGHQVAFMYREEPEDEEDSGWRILAGIEDQEYLDTPGNGGLYDVNAIANADPDIVPFLDAPVGSAFARGDDEEGGGFIAVDMEEDYEFLEGDEEFDEEFGDELDDEFEDDADEDDADYDSDSQSKDA
jgi:hypothetical protein